MTPSGSPGASSVVGVILAAGHASRFGAPKQLLELDGRPLLEHVVANARASRLDRVVVVLGNSAEEIVGRVDLSDAEVVDNRDFGSGCSSSLIAGLATAGACDGLMLLLGDQPGVRSTVIDAVLQSWLAAPTWAAVTYYREALGHPFVFSREAFDALRALQGDKAVWRLLEERPADVSRISIEAALPPDLDTAADFDRVLAHWRNSID